MKQTQLHHYALRRPDGNRPDDPINCVKAKVATDALQHAIGAKAKHMEELAHAVDETHASVRVMEYAAAANVGMQGVGTQDLVGLCAEIQKTQQTIKAQHVEMQELKKINEQLMEQIMDLTQRFGETAPTEAIDRLDDGVEMNVQNNLVNDGNALAHVQGAAEHVKETAGHVQSDPTNVSNLGIEKETIGNPKTPTQVNDEIRQRIQFLRGRQAQKIASEASSSRQANQERSGFLCTSSGGRNAEGPQENLRPQQVSALQQMQQVSQRVTVDFTPQLPSGTKRAIEKVIQENLQRMGIVTQIHSGGSPNVVRPNEAVESTARNNADFNTGNSQFLVPNLQANTAVPNVTRQPVFATAQWRPKEPPIYTGAATDDVYLWTSLVRQYFVFMHGTTQQEVAFAATLLRGAAHEWYLSYERRNGNKPPRDWPTMMQALLERFGSNIRAQEAQSKLMNISQGKRIVREYTSEFETLLGRLTTRDEATWLNVYIWGLQPHLATAVALKYPTTIAQASGHAEATELALRASQRPNIGENAEKNGTRSTGAPNGRGDAQGGPRKFAQGQGRSNIGLNQCGGKGPRRRRVIGRNHGGRQQNTTPNCAVMQYCSCGQYGHYASQCPKSTSGCAGSNSRSVNGRNQPQALHRIRRGQGGNKQGADKRTRFAGLSVVYDVDGFKYQVDNDGKIIFENEEIESAPLSQNSNKNLGN